MSGGRDGENGYTALSNAIGSTSVTLYREGNDDSYTRLAVIGATGDYALQVRAHVYVYILGRVAPPS